MAQLISFYSSAPGEGQRTISQNMAKILGDSGQKVLYVEMNYLRPSFARTLGFTHPRKNTLAFLRNVSKTQGLKIEPFIVDQKELKNDAQLSKYKKVLGSNVDYMALPLDYNPEELPELTDNNTVLGHSVDKFAEVFTESFKDSDYDFVLMTTPHRLDDLFCFPVLHASDMVLNITTSSPVSLTETSSIYEDVSSIERFDKAKWKTIVNKYVSEISIKQFENMLVNQEISGFILFDEEQIKNDLKGQIATEALDYDIRYLLSDLNFDVDVPVKGGFLSRFKKEG